MIDDEDNNRHNEWFEFHMRADFMSCLRELGTTPPTTSAAIIEECKKAREFERQVKDLKKADTAVILYERKFTQQNEQLEKQKKTIKSNSDMLEAKELTIRQLKKGEEDNKKLVADQATEVEKLKSEKDRLMKELEEARNMLAQNTGHQVMKQQIDK